jgi:cation diffusion facilitator CzcD-associated flavoprotein CzcO
VSVTTTVDPRTPAPEEPAVAGRPHDAAGQVRGVGTLIVGTGFAGLGMAIRLKQAGDDDFVVLERAQDVGGTWRDNTYPGCMCDVPSHLYSFSFARNPDWTRTYPKQEEIWRYLQDCARRFGVLPHLRFGHEMLSARWDEPAARWHVKTRGGDFSARFLVLGTGPLSEPRIPDIPGINTFAGAFFHSARWDHDHDLTGERVAVVGTGASAIQFIPEIQPRVARLHLFQRTAPWVLPHPNRDLTGPERWLSRRLPLTQGIRRAAIYWSRELLVLGFVGDTRVMALAERVARRHMRAQVADPSLRRKLTPHYRLGCKRILISNDYYPALTRPNVEVSTEPIREVRPDSIVTEDGVERAVDTIIAGTGFRVTDMPVAERVWGRRGARLADVWDGSPQAYLGTSVAGFPNLFILTGPNTGLGHTSLVFMIEAQIQYVLDALRVLRRREGSMIEVRADVQAAYNAGIQRRMEGTVWMTGGCASWYIDARGRNTALWPSFTWAFHRRTVRFDPAAYVISQPASQPAPAAV